MTDFTPHEAAVHEADALPVMLPVKLIGRDIVLAKIYAQLKDNQPVLIHGSAGVGKTALAATLASAYTELPGGVLWINLHQHSLADLVAYIGRAYQVGEITASETPLGLIGAAANALTQHKPLVVLDGEFDAQVAADFVTRCASGIPVLVLSNESYPGSWTAVPLEPLDPQGAALLFKHLADQDHANGEENDADVEKLVKTLEYVPFALAVAAGTIRASKQTPAEFLTTLPQIPGAHASLIALTAAFRTLTGPLQSLQGLLITLGATFGGVSAEVLSLMSGASVDVLKQAMGMLAQRHLVERYTIYGESYYALHPITYGFAQSWLRGAGRLEERQGKLREALLTYARTHSATPNFNKLALEMNNFLALARWAVEHNDRDTANQLAVALMQAGNFVNERGYVYELLTLRRSAATSTSAFPAYGGAPPPALPFEEDTADLEEEEIEEDEDELDIEDEDRLLFQDEFEEEDEEDEEEFDSLPFSIDDDEEDEEDAERATAETEVTKIDTTGELNLQESSDIARLRAALFQARQQNNRTRQAEILTQIGQSQVQAKMENEAISTFSETLTVYEALNDNKGVLATLDTLATLTAKTDNLQAAVLHATRGIPIAEQLGDKARQMRLLMALGDARQQLGESPQAARAYAQALELARSAGDHASEALLLFKLGYAQLDDNTPEAAVQTWESALKLFREQGRRDYEGRVLGGLGTAYGDLARWSESINFHTSALYIAREVKDKEEEALQLSNLGYANIQANQLGQAVLRYRQALHLAYESGSADNIVSAIVDLVRLLVESPRHLSIAELLIDDALKLDPNDRDVKRLKERIQTSKQDAAAKGIEQRPVGGTAKQYAALAYQELEA